MSTGDCNYDLVQKQHQERSSPLGAKMGRGSPVCQQIREKIIEMFKNNVPQERWEEIWIFHLQQCIT